MHYPDDFMNQILCGDCLDIMRKIPDGSVDLIVTSPPPIILKILPETA